MSEIGRHYSDATGERSIGKHRRQKELTFGFSASNFLIGKFPTSKTSRESRIGLAPEPSFNNLRISDGFRDK